MIALSLSTANRARLLLRLEASPRNRKAIGPHHKIKKKLKIILSKRFKSSKKMKMSLRWASKSQTLIFPLSEIIVLTILYNKEILSPSHQTINIPSLKRMLRIIWYPKSTFNHLPSSLCSILAMECKTKISKETVLINKITFPPL